MSRAADVHPMASLDTVRANVNRAAGGEDDRCDDDGAEGDKERN